MKKRKRVSEGGQKKMKLMPKGFGWIKLKRKKGKKRKKKLK